MQLFLFAFFRFPLLPNKDSLKFKQLVLFSRPNFRQPKLRCLIILKGKRKGKYKERKRSGRCCVLVEGEDDEWWWSMIMMFFFLFFFGMFLFYPWWSELSGSGQKLEYFNHSASWHCEFCIGGVDDSCKLEEKEEEDRLGFLALLGKKKRVLLVELGATFIFRLIFSHKNTKIKDRKKKNNMYPHKICIFAPFFSV